MTDDESIGDPIPEVFPPDRVEARFVVAMAMARNDIHLALRDGIEAAKADRTDFSYRVRLVTSHLVEALDSLNAYSQAPEVQALLSKAPAWAQQKLSQVRGVLQKTGPKVLSQVRQNTFHFPSPNAGAGKTSDEQLRDVLAAMADKPCELHLDHRGEFPVVTQSFASEAALALAIAKHSVDPDAARRQFEITSEGAVAFTHWADAMVLTYMEDNGGYLGTPRPLE